MTDYERLLSEFLDTKQYEKELREAIKGGPAVGLTPAEMAAFLSRKADDASSRPQ